MTVFTVETKEDKKNNLNLWIMLHVGTSYKKQVRIFHSWYLGLVNSLISHGF